MKVDLRKALRVGLVLMALPMGGEALATCIDDCDTEPEAIPSTLPDCNNVSLGGIELSCPTGDRPRIVQVSNPDSARGTSPRLTCACNAQFDRCNPNRPAGTKVSKGELEACEPGTLKMVPSGTELDGSSTTYCVTVGGKRTCYNRK